MLTCAGLTPATDFNRRHNLLYIAFETFVEKRKNDAFGTPRKQFLHKSGDEFDWFYDYYLANDAPDADTEALIRRAIAVYNNAFGRSGAAAAA